MKELGKFYTPKWISDIILDKVLPEDMSNIKVCDPSCGDGAFLVNLAHRICFRYPDEHAAASRLRNIYGFDIDEEAVEVCKDRLNSVLNKYFVGFQIDWNLHHIDATDKDAWENYKGYFDVVVGNPPYVRIQNLTGEAKDNIKRFDWKFLKGNTDLYLLFFEYGMDLLKEGGILSYISPNSWMKTAAGKPLRNYLYTKDIEFLYDFKDYQVFKGLNTYLAIVGVRKTDNAKGKDTAECAVLDNINTDSNYELVKHNNWSLVHKDDISCIKRNKGDVNLRSVADINVGIQTLADSVFIMGKDEARERDIEEGILRDIVKVSVMNEGYDIGDRVIIYPYHPNGNEMNLEEISVRFPRAYSYLVSKQETLKARDKGKKVNYEWYHYGRKISILRTVKGGIITSGMNKEPNFQICKNQDALFYGGYIIRPYPDIDVNRLLSALNSEKMATYIKYMSKPFRNGYYSYAKGFISDFPLKWEEVCKQGLTRY